MTFLSAEGFSRMMPRSQFMKLFSQSLSKNIANFDLNGAMLAEDLGMSRMHLHRHLHRYFGESAREVIIMERMQIARKLLLDKCLTINRVALLTGYQDPAYFSRTFRRIYGLSPSGFRSSKED